MNFDERINYTKYLGIPYKISGVSWSGADCWGLIKIIVENEFGMKIPTKYSVIDAHTASNDELSLKGENTQYGNWYKIIDTPIRNSVGICRTDDGNSMRLHAVYFIDPKLTMEMLSSGVFVCRNNLHKQYLRFYTFKEVDRGKIQTDIV